MRTITELAKEGKKIYFYLANEKIGQEFLADAEKEGYTFGDGVKPTERSWDDIMALTEEQELCYLGWAGRVRFHYNSTGVIKVDYKRYKRGDLYYIYDN